MVWHRRAGKDALSINFAATSAFQRVGLYWHILPTYEQGRKIIWEGKTREGKKFLDAFPGHDRIGAPDSVVKRKRDDKMFIELVNGSIYQVVGTDEIDKLVGSNPIGCIFSEYSLQDPEAYKLISPILNENGGWAIFIYTPRGKNHGYKLYQLAKKNPNWFCELLTIDQTRREDGTALITQAMLDEERLMGQDESLIQQEYYCSFEAGMIGSYYLPQIKLAEEQNRIGPVPWEPRINVDTFWDLGISDAMTILFAQRVAKEIRIIDYMEGHGEGIPYYIKKLRERPYSYGDHYAPHDIKVRELGTGRSRFEVARELGVTFRVTPKLEVADGIEAVRSIFPSLWISNQGPMMERFLDAIKEYHKEWDEKLKIFHDRPTHDWSSHPADALRVLALNYRSRLSKMPTQTHAINAYEIHGGNEFSEKSAFADKDYDELSH